MAVVGSPQPESLTVTARENELRALHVTQPERQYFADTVRNGPLPRFGVALSGGGSRAAAFAIGVLASLNDSSNTRLLQTGHRLADVDVVSSVSGGGYANYYTNIGRLRTGRAALGDELEPSARLLRAANTGITSPEAVVVAIPMLVLCAVPSVALRLLPGEDGSLTCANAFYGSRLWSAYDPAASRFSLFPQHPLVGDLGSHDALGHRVPYPIFAATALTGADRSCFASRRPSLDSLHWSVAEITPVHVGSSFLGYLGSASRDDPKTDSIIASRLQLRLAASISGSAPDSRTLRGWCAFSKILGIKIGARFKPFYSRVPVLLTDSAGNTYVEERDATLTVEMIDGGDVENLALYPQISRLTRDILIVDAEHDPMRSYRAYWCVKERLERVRVKLSIPGIEADDEYRDAAVTCDERGSRSGDAARRGDDIRAAVPSSVVHTGAIENLPRWRRMDGDSTIVSRTRVTYVKLAIPEDLDGFLTTVRTRYLAGALDPKDATEVYDRVRQFLEEDRKRFSTVAGGVACRRSWLILRACPFPAVTTGNQNLEEGQYMAYYFLGRYVLDGHLSRGDLFRDSPP